MLSTTEVALIGVGGTALGALINAVLPPFIAARREKKRDKDMFPEVDPARVSAVTSSVWTGSLRDSEIEMPEWNMTAAFEKKTTRLIAKVTLSLPQGVSPRPDHLKEDTAIDDIIMTGGFYDSWYLQFTYESRDPGRKQMGVAVLRLSAEGDRLAGHYAGFSPYRERFVTGTVALHR